MAAKNRILLLKEYLEENTDEGHSVTTAQIREYLKDHGCPVTVQTLRTDIESLRESGYDITQRDLEGMPTRYVWADREWSAPEGSASISVPLRSLCIPPDGAAPRVSS